MYGSRPRTRTPISFGSGAAGPPPRDLVIILATLFVTFSMRAFEGTRLLPALLELTPLVWARGFVWQVATYPFVGGGAISIWFLLELLILFWFGRDVYRYLGRKAFWSLIVWSAATAGVVAVLVDWASALAGASPLASFQLMQGQRVLMAIFITAFACAYRNATIYLFFVLPVQARWFIAIEILLAFMGFLGTKDLAGFVGICTAVGMTWAMLSGGLMTNLRRMRLRLQHYWYRGRLAAERKKRGMRVVRGGKGRPGNGSDEGGSKGGGPRQGPWVH